MGSLARLVAALLAATCLCAWPASAERSQGGRRLGAGSAATRRSLAQAAESGGSGAAGAKCPPLSKELLQKHAKENTVMLAVANTAQWDFAVTWMRRVQQAGVTYAVVAASDAETSRRLTEMGQACFEWIDNEAPKLGLRWGEEGWRRMTWSKVFVVDAVVDWGFNLVISDVDVVWFKDPLPLFAVHKHADLIFSEDGTATVNEPGDAGLSADGDPYHDFNTGVYLMRATPNATAWTHAWRAFFDQCKMHDQHCAYELMRQVQSGIKHPQDPRVRKGWRGGIYLAIMPPSIFMNAHTYFLQQLHKVKRVEPYAVHLTWTYNGIPGKRSRLRDMGLWEDPPAYYGDGDFVTADVTLPEPPPQYNAWNENEDMITFYLDSIGVQLQQAYVGMALALASGRAFILPKFQCYCEKIWYGVVRCRVVDAQTMPFPVPCPQDYLFDPANYDDAPEQWGPALPLREASFLENERTPQEVKDSVLIIQPSAALDCDDCVREGAGSEAGVQVLLVPPALTDAQLLPLLEPYKRYRVWRLSFEGVGATRRAFGGFADAATAEGFDRRTEHMTTDFCCRREEEAPHYHKQHALLVRMNVTTEFKYSRPAQGEAAAQA